MALDCFDHPHGCGSSTAHSVEGAELPRNGTPHLCLLKCHFGGDCGTQPTKKQGQRVLAKFCSNLGWFAVHFRLTNDL